MVSFSLQVVYRGNIDLNRDFPDPLLLGSTGLHPTGDEQPETLALMKWTTDTHFVASASMHEVGYGATSLV